MFAVSVVFFVVSHACVALALQLGNKMRVGLRTLEISDRNGRELQGSIKMRNYGGLLYTGQLEIGSPGQVFNVAFDTGSADLWVRSAKAKEKKTNLHYYNSSWSSSFVDIGTVWSIKYATAKCTGFLSKDIIRLGQHEVSLFFACVALY